MIDNESHPGAPDFLDLFSLPPTQKHITRVFPMEFFPKNPIDTVPLLFEIPANPHFTFVGRNELQIKFKIVKADGSDLVAGDDVCPINYMLHSLWEQVRVYSGGKLLWDSHNTYPYKAMLECLLGYSQAEKDTLLSTALYIPDGPGDLNTLTEGAKARGKFTGMSNIMQVCGSLHIDPFCQERPWPPYVPFSVELFRANDDFLLQSIAGVGYKLKILEAKLMFRMGEITADYTMALEKELMKRPGCKYAIRRSEIKLLHLETGRNDIVQTQLHTGLLPRRVILAMVEADSFYGNLKKNPFNFEHFNLNYIQLTAGGKLYPPKPLEPDFTKNNFTLAYSMLNETMKTDTGAPCGITRKQFKNGYMLFCFDLSQDYSGSAMYFNLQQTGSLELMVRFKSDLAQPIKVIFYMEFDGVLTLDRFRRFYLDAKI